MPEFKPTAPSADAVFYRTYSRRKPDGQRESFAEAMTRCVDSIAEVGKFDHAEKELVKDQALKQHCFPSGRAFWVAGTEWGAQQKNFSGWYNCTSTNVNDTAAFRHIMELAMMGSGTGAMLEKKNIDALPEIKTKINIVAIEEAGDVLPPDRLEKTEWLTTNTGSTVIYVGDSREGWVEAYLTLIELATEENLKEEISLIIDLGNVRPAGERLKGFGGTANPIKLEDMFRRVAAILNGAYGRQLNSVEACLLIDEASACVVAGNIRRSAGMRQFGADDEEAANCKLGLYTQDEEGNWRVDPEKEALRMANHTRCFHDVPDYETVEESIRQQFYSGEGAIQYVPEAIARANADLLNTAEKKAAFISFYQKDQASAAELLEGLGKAMGYDMDMKEIEHRLNRYGLNPCGEIIGSDFHCNLAEIHLNTIDPTDQKAQDDAFTAGALQVAALLHHNFYIDRYQYSREIDPIVGVSFTGLFDFFVHAFGAEWLDWMMKGRPNNTIGRKFIRREKDYLTRWADIVRYTIVNYCKKHDLRVPNRMTTVQPAGTKSLLTGASSGWHPPKAQRFIRRITFGKSDPLVSALRDWGYHVIPAQSAKDEEGNLLDDILDPRVHEVLVEIPTEVSWANLPGCDEFDLSQLPIEAQWGLYMQVQNCYTEHNTSATLEFREAEIPALAKMIHDSMEQGTGYISAALLARFDANETFPRLPFEPIEKETYDRLSSLAEVWREALPVIFEKDEVNFLEVLSKYDSPDYELKGASGCDSDKCLQEATKDADQVGQKI
jgi:ribonucleotide reductase class II